MNRALALPLAAAARLEGVEFARQLIVLGCALSLILAGRALPF
ncbi:hypothetical protein [Erythrobacter sp. CCH5-A1]|jgi:hypothetical protein|nr:hypothetical protein [Erythrobacter sp. CCH5-A1]